MRAGSLDFVMCDIVETDGRPWECCPRTFLRDALTALRGEFGVRIRSSFEHEFQLRREGPSPLPFSLEAVRSAEPFGTLVMDALLEAGAEPERFFAEFAPHQFEVPVRAADGLASADRSVAVKEAVREVARQRGERVSFAPLLDPATAGNGVHVHFSLLDDAGANVLYEPSRAGSLSELGGRFAAGILRHAAALSALCAPSPVSAARLTPHRWSVGASCLAERNREALLRIPSVATLGGGDPAAQFHLEYRGADGAANPYLALGAIARAGLEGLREELPSPPLLDRDPSELEPADAERYGVGAQPESLEQSLAALAGDAIARAWMTPLMHEAYASVKRAELEAAEGVALDELCARYAAIY